MKPAVNIFLKTVIRSGVLNQEQVKHGYQSVPKEQRSDPRVVAEHFIRSGKLSRFQAAKLLAGTARGLVLAPYQVLAPVGRGGMASVYLARDSRNEMLVALKVLPPKKAKGNERLLARFRREMDLCRRVAHPHIARTFEVGVEQGVYFIAMEFIPGIDLSKLVQKSGPLSVSRAARIFVEVASGLQHAHDQGLVHRDLKPSNIRVTTNDRAKVLDLGLALLEGEQTVDREVSGGHGYIVGSMDYIAPEQTIDACDVDGRSDIYAMGCSLYYTLTGQPPFPGGSSLEKIMRHRTEPPPPLIQRNSEVPQRFAELVHRMMEKDPAKRFESVEVVRSELLAWAPKIEALPEKQDDVGFRQAVATLQDAEADDDLEAIPVAESIAWSPSPTDFWIAGGIVAVGLLVALLILAIVLIV